MDTGTVDDAEGDVWAGAEFAWVNGPFSLQSEVANTALQRKHGEDDANNLWGGYLSASYFLTGEHRELRSEERGRSSGSRSNVLCRTAAPAPGRWARAPTTST